jgi:FkbM family methyltransferase
MLKKIRNIIKGRKGEFMDLCAANKLNLEYAGNKSELGILKDIFCKREYSLYFPFYKKAAVIDIGAHYGYFSIFANNNLAEGSVIIAIEPNASNYRQMLKNVAASKARNISCSNCAAGSASGFSKLYLGQSPNHSIIQGASQPGGNYETVHVSTLQEIIESSGLPHIDFLKMDCEGAEYQIISSTPDCVFDMVTTISMEFHDTKTKGETAESLIEKLVSNKFSIASCQYGHTFKNLNHGKLIATKLRLG